MHYGKRSSSCRDFAEASSLFSPFFVDDLPLVQMRPLCRSRGFLAGLTSLRQFRWRLFAGLMLNIMRVPYDDVRQITTMRGGWFAWSVPAVALWCSKNLVSTLLLRPPWEPRQLFQQSETTPLLNVVMSIPACRKSMYTEKASQFWDVESCLHRYIKLYLFYYCSLGVSLQAFLSHREILQLLYL